jgi:uncharacterized membrane protein
MVDEAEKQNADLNGGGSSTTKGSKARKRNIVIAVCIVAIVLVAAMAAVYSSTVHENQGRPSDVLDVANLNMTAVSVPLSSVSQTAVWYEYNVSGSTVRFFVVKDVNGTIHCAFDECWMCYGAHLGYRQNGSNMVENCCNMAFPIESITKEGCSGMGCCPIFLNSTVVGDQLVFTKSELARQRFTFLTVDEALKVTAYNTTHVAIPLASVSENATWYKYDISGTTVRFFAVKDANGAVHTSFDDCAKCYKKHLGYRQGETGTMVENCCNMAFQIANITAAGCSGMMCHPVYLANQVIGDQVLISIADLQTGVYLFA